MARPTWGVQYHGGYGHALLCLLAWCVLWWRMLAYRRRLLQAMTTEAVGKVHVLHCWMQAQQGVLVMLVVGVVAVGVEEG